MKSFPKLHIFLGAGGVGKTTLSASFALALAKSGKKVALLSIDPAQRLQSALGVEHLPESGILVKVPSNSHLAGELRAAMLDVGESLKRWVHEQGMSLDKQQKLFANPYFFALSEKMATASDTLASVRIAEWIEQYPEVEEFVIDTAPGLHAIDFIAKPEKVMSFLDSKIVDWLKWTVGDSRVEKQNILTRVLKGGARKILDGLALIGGRNFLVNFGEFLILLDQVFVTALLRLKYAHSWIRHPSTNFIIVSAVREDASAVSQDISRILVKMNCKPRLSIVNRAFPRLLRTEEALQEFQRQNHAANPNAQLFAHFLESYLYTQEKVFKQLELFSEHVMEIPIANRLDASHDLRTEDLCSLGENILKGLSFSNNVDRTPLF